MKDKKLFEQATELLNKNKAPYMMIQKEDDGHLRVSFKGTGEDMAKLIATLLDEILYQSSKNRPLKMGAGIRLMRYLNLIMEKNYTKQELKEINERLGGMIRNERI